MIKEKNLVKTSENYEAANAILESKILEDLNEGCKPGSFSVAYIIDKVKESKGNGCLIKEGDIEGMIDEKTYDYFLQSYEIVNEGNEIKNLYKTSKKSHDFLHSYSIETEINFETSTNSTEAYNTKDNFPYENDSSHIPNKVVPIYLTKKRGRPKGSLKGQGNNSRRKDNIRKKLIVDILNKLVQFLNVFTIDSYKRH